MVDQSRRLDDLMNDARRLNLNRREVMKRGLALGLSIPAIHSVFGNGASAQDATPAASNVVPIVGKEMTADEIKAAIESEGEVTVGNWTYTANDQLIARFQDHIQ